MRLLSWLGRWIVTDNQNGRNRKHRSRPRIRPRLELLEDRCLPSTFTVLNTSDHDVDSLRADIALAQSGDTINFDASLDGQSITLTSGELAINQSLHIEGPGAALLTISGNHASRVFDISGSATNVAIDNLTIADGLATGTTAVGTFGPVTLGGGILNTGAHVTLSGVALVDNQALAAQVGYVQTNLVSDIPNLAQLTDPNLKNPWGTSFSDTGLFSVSDQQTNVNTLYSVTAAGVSEVSPTIAIPTSAAGQQCHRVVPGEWQRSRLVDLRQPERHHLRMEQQPRYDSEGGSDNHRSRLHRPGSSKHRLGRLPLRRQPQAGENRRLRRFVQ